VPAPLVEGAVRAAAAKGAKSCMIFSAGFAEVGPEGAAMEAALARAGKETGVRLIGPNCLGAFNAATGFIPCFSTTIERGSPRPGGLGIASQSGAYGSHIYYLSRLRGVDSRYLLTTGNEVDVEVAEAVRLMAADPDVHTILAYAEGIKDGPGLVEALEVARAERKPVIFMKVGRSAIGAEAASSHTASLAGEDAVYDAVLRQHGAIRAQSTEEAIDIAYAARPRIYPTGKRLGLVTISGGAGVLMADDAEAYGLDVAPMPEAAQAALKQRLPISAPRNPVDVTAQAFNDMSLVTHFLKEMMEKGRYDSLLTFWTSVAGSKSIAPRLLEAMRAGIAGHEGALTVQCLIADAEIVSAYEADGYPVFEDPTRAVAAIAALTRAGMAFAAGRPATPEVPAMAPLPDGALGEREAKAALAAAGLPLLMDELARDRAEAVAIAGRIGGPVAMKIASPDILHKTDIGGVALGVAPADAAATYDRLAAAAAKVPGARLDGVLVAPMAPEGVDCILGGRVDPVFGPVVMFGLGGVFTEILKDVAFRRAPIDAVAAEGMIEELKGAALLKGARGAAPADLGALARAISAFSVFLAAHAGAVESVEINPLRALPEGCLGLDALIVRAGE
jgi:acyl-CoA synthetase (NDP forming)